MIAVSANSIAVLPFVNMSSDKENEYFSDGITEEIINALTKINGLQVTARTSSFSFKGKNQDVRQIGKQLGVASVLEGSVRKAGSRVRITAQLINVKDGYHFWSENYDRQLEDIFAVQDEISRRIAEKLREHMGHFEIQDQLIAPPTHNIKAYQLYLKGKYYANKWTHEDFRKGIIILEEVIDQEPEFALPYAAMADIFSAMGALGLMQNQEAFEKAKQFVYRALEINDKLPESLIALANINFWYDWEFGKAQQLLYQALDLAPGNAEAKGFLGLYKAFAGDYIVGKTMLEEALRSDPYSLPLHFGMCAVHQIMENYHKVIEEAEIVLSINPAFQQAKEMQGCAYYHLAEYEKAIALFENLPDKPNEPRHDFGWLACCYSKIGDRQKADAFLELAIEQYQQNPHFPCTIYALVVFFMENQKEKEAIRYLTAGVAANLNDFVFLRFDPTFKPLRKFPEFQALVRKVESRTLAVNASQKKNKQRYANSKLSESDAVLIDQRLVQHMQEAKPYLNAQLSLRKLADCLEVNTNYLSQVINEKHGKNFFEFVNEYRVDELKQMLKKPENRQFTILSMAFECGFNSKTTFNTAFKRITGFTPSQYLKKVG